MDDWCRTSRYLSFCLCGHLFDHVVLLSWPRRSAVRAARCPPTYCCRPTWWILPDPVSPLYIQTYTCIYITGILYMITFQFDPLNTWILFSRHTKWMNWVNRGTSAALIYRLTGAFPSCRAPPPSRRLPPPAAEELRRRRPRSSERRPDVGGDSGGAGQRAAGLGSAPPGRLCGGSEVNVSSGFVGSY